ncbi:hypothetical protein Lal_00042266 [Lupinus albus]|nr:hypothetical protein Lal_00042266 [Lupinus albus]
MRVGILEAKKLVNTFNQPERGLTGTVNLQSENPPSITMLTSAGSNASTWSVLIDPQPEERGSSARCRILNFLSGQHGHKYEGDHSKGERRNRAPLGC